MKEGGSMQAEDFDGIAIDPDEAVDLKLHVRNCIRRHTSLMRIITQQKLSNQRQQIVTWIYRSIVLPGIGFIAYELWQLHSIVIQGQLHTQLPGVGG